MGEHAPYAAGADAPVELSGGRGQLDAAIRSASEDRWLERAREAASVGAQGGLWSPKAGLGRSARSGLSNGPAHGAEGEQGLGWKAFSRRLPLLSRALWLWGIRGGVW